VSNGEGEGEGEGEGLTAYNDLASWALATLRDTDAVCDLVVGGDDGVIETGQLTSQMLQAAQATRREDEECASQVLAILVWDLGESGDVRERVASFAVLVYDRGKGYANIRGAREAVVQALVGQNVLLVRGAMVPSVRFDGRSGHWNVEEFDIDAERVNFSGRLVAELDEYM